MKTPEQKRLYMKKWWEKNGERIKRQQKLDRKKNPEKWRAVYQSRKKYFQEWFKKKYKDPEWRKKRFACAVKWGRENKNPEKTKHYTLKSRYNITLEEHTAMWNAQKGKCAICGKNSPRMGLDHDHATGKAREILCHFCNVGLGFFKDRPELLKRAISYLAKHAKRAKDGSNRNSCQRKAS